MFDSYAEIFEQRAGSYNGAMQRWPRARDAEFEAVLAPLRTLPDGLVCDLPSGGGYLADYLRPGMDYVGIDPADGFFADGAAPAVRHVTAAIDQVPFPDGSVDYIVSLAGLHHEPDVARVFREMRRLISAHGRIVICDVAAGTPAARFLNGYVARHNPRGHDGRFFGAETRGELEAAGLRVVDDAMIASPWIFDSRGQAGAFCSELFGLCGVDQGEVADALAQQIDFDDEPGCTKLRWTLRRLVCDVA